MGSTVVSANRGSAPGPEPWVRWSQGRRRGARERRLTGGSSSAIIRSSRTRASMSVGVAMCRTFTVVSSICATWWRFSAAVK